VADDGDVVVVTGATGRIGGAVARHLLEDGWTVRAVTRTPDSAPARALTARGAEVVAADLDDPGALGRAMAGAAGVFSVQNPMTTGLEAEVRHGCAVADAAAAAAVSHLVYGSAGVGRAGTGVGPWETKLQVQAHMAELGLPVTVLRPMALMELMTDPGFYPAVSTWHLMPRLVGGDRPLPWISADDVGAVAARAFAEPDRFVGADLPLAVDIRSIDECRTVYAAVRGRRPRRIPMPVPVFRRVVGEDLLTMWRWLAEHDLDAGTSATRALLPDAVDVRGFLERHR
jgi:uncharacterized protein YbjT (DUF2867 family)